MICLCKTPGVTTLGACPICTPGAVQDWKLSPAAQRPRRTRTARGGSTRRSSAPASSARMAAPSRAPSTPALKVAVCGAQYPRVAFRRCNLNAGHAGNHLAIGGITWTDAPPAALAPPPVRRDGAAPQVVGADEATEEATDPGVPEFTPPAEPSVPFFLDCRKPVDMGIGDFPCTLPSGHSGACSAVSQKEQEAGAARAARVQAPPAPTPKVELEWRRIPQASRPAILEMVRSTFTRERDTFKGTFRVARLADRNAFPERDAELRILDLRATVDASTLERRPANASDKYRLEEILSECISELGFDPRSQDDKGEPIPDGAALLEAILA